MFIDKNSISVTANGTTINLGDYLVQVTYGYNKLWGEDSGRNLAGNQTGTLLGIFPKLECQFRRLSQEELQTIAPILDSATQSITYYDPNKSTYTTIQTYAGDYSILNKSIGINQGFNVSFIARSKRQ